MPRHIENLVMLVVLVSGLAIGWLGFEVVTRSSAEPEIRAAVSEGSSSNVKTGGPTGTSAGAAGARERCRDPRQCWVREGGAFAAAATQRAASTDGAMELALGCDADSGMPRLVLSFSIGERDDGSSRSEQVSRRDESELARPLYDPATAFALASGGVPPELVELQFDGARHGVPFARISSSLYTSEIVPRRLVDALLRHDGFEVRARGEAARFAARNFVTAWSGTACGLALMDDLAAKAHGYRISTTGIGPLAMGAGE